MKRIKLLLVMSLIFVLCCACGTKNTAQVVVPDSASEITTDFYVDISFDEEIPIISMYDYSDDLASALFTYIYIVLDAREVVDDCLIYIHTPEEFIEMSLQETIQASGVEDMKMPEKYMTFVKENNLDKETASASYESVDEATATLIRENIKLHVVDVIKEHGEVASADNIIDGFKKAVYEDYNYQGSGQDKKGEKVYVEGIVKECFLQNETICIFLDDIDGNQWVVAVAARPFYSVEKIKQLTGKEVRIMGDFMGFSNLYELPSMHTHYEDAKIQLLSNEGEVLYRNNFIAEKDEFTQWFEENPNEILYSKHNELERGTVATSTGIIKSVEKYGRYWIDFYQETEGGYEFQTISLDEMGYDDVESLLQLSAGDGIKYYYVVDTEKVIPIAFDIVELDYTLDDVESDYKKRCNAYTYEEIARNPESVKGERAVLVGEVVQVVEDGSSVILRVNITKNAYGYYEDTIYVSYNRDSKTEDRILEDDIITIYGLLSGTETYTSTLGASITLPKVIAEYITIN